MSTPKKRCCANCAVSFLIEPPVVVDPSKPHIRPDAKPIRVCRAKPPEIQMVEVPTVDRRGNMTKQVKQNLAQNITGDEWVCWQWVPPGYLPGERLPPYQEGQRQAVDRIIELWEEAQAVPQVKQ